MFIHRNTIGSMNALRTAEEGFWKCTGRALQKRALKVSQGGVCRGGDVHTVLQISLKKCISAVYVSSPCWFDEWDRVPVCDFIISSSMCSYIIQDLSWVNDTWHGDIAFLSHGLHANWVQLTSHVPLWLSLTRIKFLCYLCDTQSKSPYCLTTAALWCSFQGARCLILMTEHLKWSPLVKW